jgi:hypothetical protein
VDVVDGEYQSLSTALDSSQDFESLQSSLDQFLKALHVQCFLSSPIVLLFHPCPYECRLLRVTAPQVSKACADSISVCAKMIRRLDSGVAITVMRCLFLLCL